MKINTNLRAGSGGDSGSGKNGKTGSSTDSTSTSTSSSINNTVVSSYYVPVSRCVGL